MSLSRKELDLLRPMVDRTVQKFLGFSESTLVTAAVNCVDKGYDRRKTRDKLSSILDESQASRFTEKLFELVEDFSSSGKKPRKRKDGDREKDKGDKVEEPPEPKKVRKFEDVIPAVPEPGKPSPGQLTADKIKEMMANAQKMIQERKAQLQATMPVPPSHSIAAALSQGSNSIPAGLSEKEKRARELQAKIQAQLVNAGLTSPSALNLGSALKLGTSASQPAPVILDELGRTIDVNTGEAVHLTQHMPTLKANIRAKRREQFKHNLLDKAPEDITESKFFDSRVSVRGATRAKRSFRFHEKGRFEQQAQRMRTKAQLEKLQAEIAQTAKKTGIASAAKLATIAPRKELKEGEVPDVEWWDSIIIRTERYDDIMSENGVRMDVLDGITRLVEHPTQMKSPVDPEKEVVLPVMLTKKERKKLRRQNRNEAQKEMQEKIRLGLMPPPEPKVRMANLMRVLGNEAVQDPTKVEAHVRAQMAKRQKAHEEANAARKLTPEQRREKKTRKLKEDTSDGVHVSVYRIRSLNNPSKKFKIEANCKQLFMTGFVVLFKDCNVVVVEGGPKQQKKFRRLMLHRIKWEEDKQSKEKGDDGEDTINKCDLVWEGMVTTRAFSEIIFKFCPTEMFAREQFKKHAVEHYWDLAYSGAVLEAAGEQV